MNDACLRGDDTTSHFGKHDNQTENNGGGCCVDSRVICTEQLMKDQINMKA